MNRRPTTRGARKNNRRLITFLWIAVPVVLTFLLLYFEQTAILYLLATLGVTVLLIVVASADLKGAQRNPGGVPLGNDAAAIGSGITGTAAVSSPATSTRRPARKRK